MFVCGYVSGCSNVLAYVSVRMCTYARLHVTYAYSSLCTIPSCSHFLDNMVAIWDFRRPYVPFASFSEHADDITGISGEGEVER